MADQIPPEVASARANVSQLALERDALLRDFAHSGTVDHASLAAIDQRIASQLDGVLQFLDPLDASADVPLVLLPVRLETRFATGAQAAQLKVRIFPDEIHVDDLVRGLTDAEVVAGEVYWTSAWTDPVPEAAWPTLVAAVGPDRAEWVAHICTPANLTQRGAATPVFTAPQPRGPRNIVARALPDRFVVLVVQGDQVSEAVGRPIPPDLAMSTIPLDGDAPARIADALTIPPGSEWLVDYDRAVEVGMGVTVTLGGGAAPVDRVIALGTRASLTASSGADELEDLLLGHRFGSAGLSLLAQGTPTNNTDGLRSPYRARREPVAPPLTTANAKPGSDAAAAAQTLGVDAARLSGLVGDGSGEQEIAGFVNTALWAPGWGEYLARLDSDGVPGVVDAQRESARELFRDHVRGRGCAPAIRVGAQPYGVLTVSDLTAWVPQAGETTAGVLKVVRALLGRWTFAADHNVPLIREGAAKLDERFLEVLGSAPVMLGLRVRPVLDNLVSTAIGAALGVSLSSYEAEKLAVSGIAAQLFGTDAAQLVIGSLHATTRPLPLPLASARDLEFIQALLGNPSKVLAVDSVLQALLVLAWQSSELDVAKAAPASVLPALVDLAAIDARLKVETTAIAARADAAAPAELHGMVARLQEAGVTAAGASTLREFQPVEQIQTSLAEVALSAPDTPQARSIAAGAIAGWLLAMGYRNEVRAAMQALTATDLTARSLAVAEALDCTSHRLDAWATAIVSDRRARQIAGSAGGNSRGLTIGAYGIVENLRPQSGPSLDGWIHAPSTRHAMAAGMLRSAHLSHLPDGGPAGDGGPFAIDLSSLRVQSARHVIDGVRQGQQLGALIGYQIERGLAAARLSRLALSLRAIAPLVARRLSDGDGADPQAAKESVAATNVVDGVLLLHTHPPGDPALRAALDLPPANVYLRPGDWQPLTNDEWAAVTTVMHAAADTIDAVSDVMLSESVLQFAGGNPHRAAAAMDAMSTGESPSDTIDVLEAQDSGERLTHRVLAVVGAGPPASGWNATRPRAQVEPRLEAWAAAHLGSPSNVVLADVGGQRLTLDQAGLGALDFVYATDPSALERALRMVVPELADAPLAVARDPAWPSGLRAIGQVIGLATSLRAIIAGAHPLLPAELVRPGEQPARDLAAALPELTTRIQNLAGSLAAAVAALAPTIATIPADGVVADPGTAGALARAVYALEPFGVTLEPTAERPLDVSWLAAAWHAAQARSEAIQAGIARISALPAGTSPSLALDAAQAAVDTVFGDGFLVVPLLAPGAAADGFVDAVTAPAFPAPPASAVRRLVRDLGTVRPQVGRLSEALLLEGALAHPRSPVVAQLSGRDATGPAPGTTQWLAGQLPAAGPWPASPVAHLVLDAVGTIDVTAALAGLVIDAWVEAVPAQVGPKADPADPRPGRAVTGVAIRYDAPSVRPPQALLSALSPDGSRWTTASLRGVVEHTLDLAKARMVTLERLAGDGMVLPALYTKSASLQGEEYVQWGKFGTLATVATEMPFVRESSP